jgi:hypothetical protein
MNAYGGISKTRSELQLIDAVIVDDAIYIDVSDVAFGS